MGETIERACKGCGKTFAQDGKRPGQKFLYCSEECRVRHWRRQDHEQRVAAHERRPDKTCQNCGKEFRGTFGRAERQKFCSEQCRKDYGRWQAPDVPFIREADPSCPHCGRQFKYSKEHGGRRQKFCCDECRLGYWRAHQHLVQHKATRRFKCEECGREFEAYGTLTRRFCCNECYEKHLDGLREEVTCPVCGKKFFATKKQHRKYCGRVCTGIARTRLAMEKWIEIEPPRVEIKREPGLLPPEAEPLEAPGLEEPIWILPREYRLKRIILVCQPLDFWNSWVDYLNNHIQSELHMNPLAGDVFVFCNKKRTELRLLQWSGAGFEILSKKLGYGTFPWPKTEDAMKEIEESDFRLLLEYPRFMMRLHERRAPKKYIV
jgi:hypothetical protein